MPRTQTWREPTVAEVEADLDAVYALKADLAPPTTGVRRPSQDATRAAGYPQFTMSPRARRAIPQAKYMSPFAESSAGNFAWWPKLTKVSTQAPAKNQ